MTGGDVILDPGSGAGFGKTRRSEGLMMLNNLIHRIFCKGGKAL
jgi:hypothetical protein